MSENYNDYLKSLHNNAGIGKEWLDKICREATGAGLVEIKRIVAGEVNEVYDVKNINNKNIIVRISKKDKSEFVHEDWAMKKVKTISVPVANNLLIKDLETENGNISVCVQEKIEGSPLERGSVNIFSMNSKDKERIVVEAGEILAKIHSVKIDGFGDLDVNGKAKYSEFNKLFLEDCQNSKEYLKVAGEIGMSQDKMNTILKLIADRVDIFKNDESVLNHGDFGPKHFMYDNNKIIGILDWGQAQGNIKEGDLVWWDYWYGDSLPLEWLIKGYGLKTIDIEKVEIMKLNKGLSSLWWYWENKYKKGIEEVVAKFDESFKKLGV